MYGWLGFVFEFDVLFDWLCDLVVFGGDFDDVFDVVVFLLFGFLFLLVLVVFGMFVFQVVDCWVGLMVGFGY